MKKAYAILFDTDNSNLIIPIKRDNLVFGGMPQFFGGTKDAGESDRQTISRELQEESDEKLELLPGGLTQVYKTQVGGTDYAFYVAENFSGKNYLGPLKNSEMKEITKYYIEEFSPYPETVEDMLKALKIQPTIQFVDSATYTAFSEALQWIWKTQKRIAEGFINAKFDALDKALGVAGKLKLSYNNPVNVPQNFSAEGKTTQQLSVLAVQNLSAAFDLTVFINPDPTGKNVHTIKANDAQPIRIVNNWNGSILKVANISQEAATAQVTLV